ncbi:cation transporter [Nannocystis pusilla]|uniref:Cation transporter n=1 Tax=Nannocystis pusilla TaxID=889268 RepID=A0ABS7TU60_9BACT|nr:cation transporter [Nannocystis pusilla]MBZ5711780.1 cation transporter [Nannocystis pusilla]
MSNCCAHELPAAPTRAYRRVLVAALWINFVMFMVEVVAGWFAESAALQADALDFLGDAGSYAVSLLVLERSLRARSLVALAKGVTMGLFGVVVLVRALVHALWGSVPQPETMGVVAVVALIANLAVARMLYRYRDGDSNMRSVWLCSRNDALANLAVLLAASGVFALGSGWPDLLVALVIAGLALSGAAQVVSHALRETRRPGCRARS